MSIIVIIIILIIIIIHRLITRAMSEYMINSEVRAVARWKVGSCLRITTTISTMEYFTAHGRPFIAQSTTHQCI